MMLWGSLKDKMAKKKSIKNENEQTLFQAFSIIIILLIIGFISFAVFYQEIQKQYMILEEIKINASYQEGYAVGVNDTLIFYNQQIVNEAIKCNPIVVVYNGNQQLNLVALECLDREKKNG